MRLPVRIAHAIAPIRANVRKFSNERPRDVLREVMNDLAI